MGTLPDTETPKSICISLVLLTFYMLHPSTFLFEHPKINLINENHVASHQ
jgi:hypothetical protein